MINDYAVEMIESWLCCARVNYRCLQPILFGSPGLAVVLPRYSGVA
jgi:hypothetical protein